MKIIRYISYLSVLCLVLLTSGCNEDLNPNVTPSAEDGDGDVTLTLNVSIVNSSLGKTRAGQDIFWPTDIDYEKINTLRVIIVRENNTVEYNRLVRMPDGVGVDRIGELEFKVSTDLAELYQNPETHKWYRTEKKHIYLIANEASIPTYPGEEMVNEVKGLLEDLKEGDVFTSQTAAEQIIYNKWSSLAGSSEEEVKVDKTATPFIDNEGKPVNEKKYVPMTEFFEISVTENVSDGKTKQEHKEDLFITRNLVKFEFEIDSTPEMESFRVTDITFNSLMQKEYLFPNNTEYSPAKYNENGTVNIEDKEIKSYKIPGFKDNDVRPYVFKPSNFGYNSKRTGAALTTYNSAFKPALYFCESKTLEGDEEKLSIFSLSIGVEFDTDEAALDNEGNPVLDAEGNPTYKVLRMEFDAQNLNLPEMLPRNTIVRVKMSLKNGELSAVATVFPYTAVNLNPEFGFIKLVESVTISERSQETGKLEPLTAFELKVGESRNLIGTVWPENANNQDIVWMSSEPEVVTVSEIGTVTAIALPEGKDEAKVNIIAMAADGSGKSTTCEVTVKKKTPVDEIIISPPTWTDNIGMTTNLTAIIKPEEATVQDIIWESSDTKIATVSSYGVVKAVGQGDAIITAKTTDGKVVSNSCHVHVNNINPVINITLSDGPSGAFYPGQKFSFNATIEPADATYQGIEWSTSNESIATVTKYGLVTALKEGDVKIIATAKDGSTVSSYKEIHVSKPQVTGIEITRGGSKVTSWDDAKPGQKRDIRATIIPYDATYKQVTWSSDDETVATIEPIRVDQTISDQAKYGTEIVYVVALKEGHATITVTSVNNPSVKTEFDVTVK